MANDTREQFLNTAEALFADRGFYGVSIAAVADELGLTKQALLHHFGTKEKLYGAVLQRISDDFERQLAEVAATEPDPALHLKTYLMALAGETVTNSVRTQLLMRELLDNKLRAEAATTWYLKSYLETLTTMVSQMPGWANATQPEAFSFLYQLLGAINYYAISQPTLRAIFGAAKAFEFEAEFPRSLSDLIEAQCDARR